jgi:hypothetical protein
MLADAGDWDTFVALCTEHNSEVDVTQVMDWSRAILE